MSTVKFEGYFVFTPEKVVRVFWCLGDGDNGAEDDTFGLEILVDEYNELTDELEGINYFGFGYEPWSQDMWEKWGRYIENVIQMLPQNEDGFNRFYDWIISLDCLYTKDENHLKDLEKMKRLIELGDYTIA